MTKEIAPPSPITLRHGPPFSRQQLLETRKLRDKMILVRRDMMFVCNKADTVHRSSALVGINQAIAYLAQDLVRWTREVAMFQQQTESDRNYPLVPPTGCSDEYA